MILGSQPARKSKYLSPTTRDPILPITCNVEGGSWAPEKNIVLATLLQPCETLNNESNQTKARILTKESVRW